jgi:protein TonB
MKSFALIAALLLATASTTFGQQETVDQPESMPVASDCVGLATVEARDQCTAEALTKHVVENLDYPKKARRKDISGLVVAQFVVDATGAVRDAEILRSPDPVLNEPVIEAILSMPTMKPGQQRGKNVAVRYALPIKFVLND